MIRAYGLHWSSDKVDWGRRGPGGAGQLLGYQTTNRNNPATRNNPADFRDQIGIYALYYDFDLVYVGRTRSPLFRRLRNHLSDHLSERWNRFSWFGTRRVLNNNELSIVPKASPLLSTSTALDVLEAVAIAIAEPRLNLKRGNWRKSAVQYFQIDSNEEGGPA